MMKKFTSIILTLIMLISLVPAVHAAKTVKSITCAGTEVWEHTDGYVQNETDSGGNVTATFFRYYAEPESITVKFSDNSTETYYTFDDCFDGTGYYPTVSSGQSASNRWGVGAHKARISLGSVFSSEYTVTVKPGIVAKVEIEDISVVEYIDGYKSYAYNTKTHEVEPYFFYNYYNSKNLKVKATLRRRICSARSALSP